MPYGSSEDPLNPIFSETWLPDQEPLTPLSPPSALISPPHSNSAPLSSPLPPSAPSALINQIQDPARGPIQSIWGCSVTRLFVFPVNVCCPNHTLMITLITLKEVKEAQLPYSFSRWRFAQPLGEDTIHTMFQKPILWNILQYNPLQYSLHNTAGAQGEEQRELLPLQELDSLYEGLEGWNPKHEV